MLDSCVAESDLVFESSSENIQIKKEIAEKVAKSLRPDAIACTGSSGLSITEIAECYPGDLKSHFFGVHMFNPPYSMSLCEYTPTKYTDREIFDELRVYLEETLHRTVVEVKDAPAFLGNRIGFQFINEALQFAEKYKDYGGIDYIDSILGPFTGRSMPPLVTANFVGLDVHKAIVDNVYQNINDYAHDSFVMPVFAEQLVKEGKLGRKVGEGLYKVIKSDSSARQTLVYDINTGAFREQIPYVFPFADKMKKYISEGDYEKAFERLVNNHSQEATICLSFLLKYIVYSVFAAKEVSNSEKSADDVMATGFNWCPPLAMFQALSTVADVKELIKDRLPEISVRIDVDAMLCNLKASDYDYRRYFKSLR